MSRRLVGLELDSHLCECLNSDQIHAVTRCNRHGVECRFAEAVKELIRRLRLLRGSAAHFASHCIHVAYTATPHT